MASSSDQRCANWMLLLHITICACSYTTHIYIYIYIYINNEIPEMVSHRVLNTTVVVGQV